MPVASVRSATFNVALLGRTKRLGAVAGGAYLAGELRAISDLSSAWDYRRKSYEVAAYGLDVPIGWDGERLWAECESRERRWDAIFGRRIIADLPHQLSHQERVAIAEAFAHRLRKLYGVAVEWAIHRPPRGGDQRNWHVHFQFTSRPISDVGTWAKSKVREWDTGVTRRQTVFEWRATWQQLCNNALEAAGIEDRVTLESFATRGVDKVAQVHHGIKATDHARRNAFR